MSHKLCTIALLLGVPTLAHAQGTTLDKGIVYFKEGPYHVVTIDNDSDSTEVHVSAPHPNPENGTDALTIQDHALEEGATVAIEGAYAGGGPYPNFFHVCGAARGMGQTYLNAYPDPNCTMSFGWARGKGAQFSGAGHEKDPNWMTQYTDIVSLVGYGLTNGQRVSWGPGLEVGRECDVMGISQDRKKIILISTDWGTCDGARLQDLLLQYGAWDATSLDGGGSTKLWIRGQGYVNQGATEEREPPTVVFARPNGTCPSDCGGAKCLQLAKPFRAQCLGDACRAGLGAVFNCDIDKVRRVKCDAGVVISERCNAGCMVMPAGTDDICIGGGTPETNSDGGMPDAGVGGMDAPSSATDPSAGGCSATPRAPVGVFWLGVGAYLFARRRKRL